MPGTELEVRAVEQAAGQVRVGIDQGERSIGENAAAGLFVKPA